MSIYALAHIIHVYCAIAFVGGVFFEMLVLSVLHTGRVRAIAPRSRTCHVLSCRPRDAACRHYPVHQRHRDGVQPLPADTAPPIRQLLRHHAEHQNPVGSKRFGTFCHRRRQNGTAHPSPSAGRNTYTPSYSAICCLSSFLPKQCSTCLGKPYPYPTHKDCL